MSAAPHPLALLPNPVNSQPRGRRLLPSSAGTSSEAWSSPRTQQDVASGCPDMSMLSPQEV